MNFIPLLETPFNNRTPALPPHSRPNHNSGFQSKRKYFELISEKVNRNRNGEAQSNSPLDNDQDEKPIARIVRLHKEIKAFYDEMSPRPEDQLMREDVIDRISCIVKSLWPAAMVDIFGSFKTGLYLPTSDIDMVIFGLWETKPLYTLKDALITKGICTDDTTRVIDKAAVPIIKITDAVTQIKVDIAFNVTSGQNSAKLIKTYLKDYPALSYLTMVLKQFLQQRELNEVYTGGIGSYGLVLMIVNFLQLQARGEGRLENVNYGVLLIEFFELFGQHFNYKHTGLSVQDGGRYVRKKGDSTGQPTLYIQDPICEENDVSRGSYNIAHVQMAFNHAYKILCNQVTSNSSNLERNILSSIMQVGRDDTNINSSIHKSSAKKLKMKKVPEVKRLFDRKSTSNKRLNRTIN